MAAKGQGLFSLYIYIEKFKNILVRNHWTDFNINIAEMLFWWPSIKIFLSRYDSSKTKAAREQGLFSPLYQYRKL